MIGHPQVLFLDEPTTGLDPRTRMEVWTEVKSMVGGGVTVLLTTQYMEEAEALASELTVVDHGKVVAGGAIDELKARVGGARCASGLPIRCNCGRWHGRWTSWVLPDSPPSPWTWRAEPSWCRSSATSN